MPKAGKIGKSQVVETVNPTGTGPALILCEHATWAMPEPYRHLGLSVADRQSHAAWDPGARAVAGHLSAALNAPLIASRVSRLVYDCNRPPEAASAMPDQSELIAVPGNTALTEDERVARTREIYVPFCSAVQAMIEQRKSANLPTALITVHSFTPVYFGQPRAVEIGILNDEDSRLADAMLAEAGRLPHRRIARNDPYGPEDGVTHSLRLHGLGNGLANVMLEIRNDLLRSPQEEAAMAQELMTLISPALARLAQGDTTNA